MKNKGKESGYIENGTLYIEINGKKNMLLSVRDMQLKGEHNMLNAMAASLAASRMGLEIDAVREGLRTFAALEHRLEFVREINGVSWYNDSKATNVDAVWYGLGGFDKPIILIAGGRDKDSDFSKLYSRVKQNVKALILIGEARKKMASVLQGAAEIIICSSLHEAVKKAGLVSGSGEVVLLSPACASFDMFENYEERGNQFKKLVEELADECE